MSGISSPIASPCKSVIVAPLGRPHKAELITGVPAKVSVTSPANLASNIQLDIVISWGRPSMAQSYDVYFGTTSGSLTQVVNNQLARSYVPASIELDTTYYFRIDSVNSFGTTQGDEINFTTWSASDILLDENNEPITDEWGDYIETA